MIPALLLVACAPKIDAGPVPVEVAALPVRVLERHDDVSPAVWFEARIFAGSAADPVGKEGLAALTAQALAEAGAGDRTAAQVRDALYPLGQSLDVYVDREWVSLRLTCPADQATTCAGLFADALTRPRFAAEDVERLRDDAAYAVTDGLLASEEAIGRAAWDALLYEAHPYGHPILGRAGALATLTPDDLRAFWAEHYVRQAVTVGLAGRTTPALVADLQARLEVLPTTPMPEQPLLQPLSEAGRRLAIVDTDGAVTGFHFGVPWELDRNDEDFPALYLAFTALGSHRQSFGRLYQRMRQARGLNYGDYAYAEPFVQRGSASLPEQGVLRRQTAWTIWIRPTSDENAAFALKLAVDEVERFARDGLTAAEFEDVRSHLSGFVPLLARDPGRRLSFALDAATTGTPDLLELMPAALPKLTLEQVNAAITRNVHPEALRIVAVGGDGPGLEAALKGTAPTPIHYADVTPDPEQAARDAEIAAKPLGIQQITVTPADGLFR